MTFSQQRRKSGARWALVALSLALVWCWVKPALSVATSSPGLESAAYQASAQALDSGEECSKSKPLAPSLTSWVLDLTLGLVLLSLWPLLLTLAPAIVWWRLQSPPLASIRPHKQLCVYLE